MPWAVVLEGFQGQQHPHQYVLDSSADLAMAGQDKDMVESLLWLLTLLAGPCMARDSILAPNHWFPLELGEGDISKLLNLLKTGAFGFPYIVEE